MTSITFYLITVPITVKRNTTEGKEIIHDALQMYYTLVLGMI